MEGVSSSESVVQHVEELSEDDHVGDEEKCKDGGPASYILQSLQVEPAKPLPRNLKAVAEETLRCCEKREYTNGAAEVVLLPIDKAVQTTWLHPRSAALPKLLEKESEGKRCVVSVVQCGTMSAADALVRQGLRTCVLNFASGRNRGGGWLRGANAQEEALCRVCGLYPCLLKPEVESYYEENALDASCVYEDNAIVSPEVSVFRADDGSFLDAPYLVGIITAPAPNMGVAMGRKSSGGVEKIKEVRRRRMAMVLTLCAAEGFDAVVLGAWGCGVFRNDPVEVAHEFRELLQGRFCNTFSRVAFAVIDEATCSIFRSAFAGESVVRRSIISSKAEGKGKGKGKSKGHSSKGQDKHSAPHKKEDSRKPRRWAKHGEIDE